MPRVQGPILYLFIACCFFLNSCSSTTGTDNSKEEEKESTPSFTLKNLSQHSTLKGKISFSISGQAEQGFSELRVYVGDQQVAAYSKPELPFEQVIESYQFDNGDYNITAELDLTGGDSTLSHSIPVTFENYLFEFHVNDNLISDFYDQTELFISDPRGNILRSVDLTQRNRERIQLLPPSKIIGESPEYINVTIAEKRNGNYEDTYLDTYAGLTPWQPAPQEVAEEPPAEDTDYKELTLAFTNIPDKIGVGVDTEFNVPTTHSTTTNDTTYQTITYPRQANHLLMTAEDMNWTSGEENYTPRPPRLLWEKNLEELELSDGDTLYYDVEKDFQHYAAHRMNHSPDLTLEWYSYAMSVKETSWDTGTFSFSFNELNAPDPYEAEGELGVLIPEANHLFKMFIRMKTHSGDVRYTQKTIGDIPSYFRPLEADIQLLSSDLSKLEVDVEGDINIIEFYAPLKNPGDNESGSWIIHMPDSMSAVNIPKITTITDWKRYQLESSILYQHNDLDGYGQYLHAELRNGLNFSNKYLSKQIFHHLPKLKRRSRTFDQQREVPIRYSDHIRYSRSK